MTDLSERSLELAQMRTEQERDAGVASARALLRSAGSDACIDCRDLIEPERRRALPSADRCFSCQCEHEKSPA